MLCEFLDVYLVDRLVVGVASCPRSSDEACWRRSERPDPVLRGGLGAERGGPPVDFLCLL